MYLDCCEIAALKSWLYVKMLLEYTHLLFYCYCFCLNKNLVRHGGMEITVKTTVRLFSF